MSGAAQAASAISWRWPRPSAPPYSMSMHGSISQSPSAQSELPQGNIPLRRSDRLARYSRLGEIDAFYRAHRASSGAVLSGALRDDRDRLRRNKLKQMVDGLHAHA